MGSVGLGDSHVFWRDIVSVADGARCSATTRAAAYDVSSTPDEDWDWLASRCAGAPPALDARVARAIAATHTHATAASGSAGTREWASTMAQRLNEGWSPTLPTNARSIGDTCVVLAHLVASGRGETLPAARAILQSLVAGPAAAVGALAVALSNARMLIDASRAASWPSGALFRQQGADLQSVRWSAPLLEASEAAFSDAEGVFGELVNAPSRDAIAKALSVGDRLVAAALQMVAASERRVYGLVHGDLSGLPSCLVEESGLNSGLMLAQYTAASLVCEARGLAVSPSLHVVPSRGHRDDWTPSLYPVSLNAIEVFDRLADVVAIELLCGAQAVDLAAKAGRPVACERAQGVAARVRQRVSMWTEDRILYPDLVAVGEWVRSGELQVEAGR